jgi:hypothetical protein
VAEPDKKWEVLQTENKWELPAASRAWPTTYQAITVRIEKREALPADRGRRVVWQLREQRRPAACLGSCRRQALDRGGWNVRYQTLQKASYHRAKYFSPASLIQRLHLLHQSLFKTRQRHFTPGILAHLPCCLSSSSPHYLAPIPLGIGHHCLLRWTLAATVRGLVETFICNRLYSS